MTNKQLCDWIDNAFADLEAVLFGKTDKKPAKKSEHK